MMLRNLGLKGGTILGYPGKFLRQKSFPIVQEEMGVSKNRGIPKMDGENNGKPYEQMDDLGVPLFLEIPKCVSLCMFPCFVYPFTVDVCLYSGDVIETPPGNFSRQGLDP